MLLTWVELSKKALLNNIAQIKKRVAPRTKIIAVVKANAYGHGLLEVVSQITDKVDYFAVFSFEDAILLRKKNIKKPLLMLGRIFPDQIDLAKKNNIEITVSTFDILQIATQKKLVIHLVVDTGMGRDGFVASDMEKVMKLLKNSSAKVQGLYSHFAASDDSAFDSYSKKQVAELMRWKTELSRIKITPLIHQSSTAGTFSPKLQCNFDMIRIGIGIYGLWPSKKIEAHHKNKTKLMSVLSWKARISEVKFLPKGSAISYGGTHILQRDSKIAVLPIGYYDGISRVTSNKGFVIVNGVKVPQIGRVTMNMIMLDVTDVKKVQVGDIATIIGREKNLEVSADDWGAWSQSVSYEVVTKINSNVKRVVI